MCLKHTFYLNTRNLNNSKQYTETKLNLKKKLMIKGGKTRKNCLIAYLHGHPKYSVWPYFYLIAQVTYCAYLQFLSYCN